MQNNGKPAVLVMTSTFPRWQGDVQPEFVIELCRRLISDINIIVLAPHAPGAKSYEEMDQIKVTRFRYAPGRLECLAGDGGIMTRLKRRPWRTLIIPLFLIGQYLALRKMFNKYSIDLIHAHWIVPQGLIAALAKKDTPLLVTSHGADLFALDTILFTWIKRYVLRRCKAITVVSSAMKHKLEKDRLSGNCPVFVLPMGTDLKTRFVPPRTQTSSKNIIFVGRLVEKKGVKYLIDAFSQVIRKYPDAVLTIVGTGPDEDEIAKQIRDLDLAANVKLPGHVEHSDLPRYYSRHAIAVVPSVVAKSGDQEGLGLVIVEALGCGCAVVASDLIAIRDIIVDGKTGLLSRPADPVDIAAKILSLLDSPNMAMNLARQGREYALDRFDWSSITPEYMKLIHDMVNQD